MQGGDRRTLPITIIVRRAAEAIQFYEAAFGRIEVRRIAEPAGGLVTPR
jgi:hypothetical protein